MKLELWPKLILPSVPSRQLCSPARPQITFRDEDMVCTRVKPFCLFKGLPKPSVPFSNKMMTFAIGFTVKLLEPRQIAVNTYIEQPLQICGLCEQLSAQCHLNSGVSPSELSISQNSLAYLFCSWWEAWTELLPASSVCCFTLKPNTLF